MPPMITPSVIPNAAGQPVAQGGTRGRSTDEAQGRSFGAALDRSRNGNAAKAQDESTDVSVVDRKPLRKAEPAEDTKDALPTDPNLAFLAPANTPLHALTLAGRTAAQDGRAADASDVPLAAGVATTDIPVDAAAPDAASKTPPGTVLTGADTEATPKAAFAGKDAVEKTAAPVAQNTPADASAAAPAPPASLQDIVRAAVAAQTMTVGGGKPSSAPAGPNVGTAAAGRTGASRAAVSTTTAEQLAAAAQPKAAEEAKAVAASTAAVPTAATGEQRADTAVATAPIAVPQPATVAASSERAADASATRGPLHTIAPEVGSEKWAPALGQQLARMSISGQHTAELNLNPAGLGPLKVTLSMGENQAQAMFVSAHESVRKAIEAALPQLRTNLSEQGITLGQASVGAETRQPFGQDAAFAQQQHQQQQNAARQQQGPAYPGSGRAAASTQAVPVVATRASVAGNASPGVDTFA
ncbi:flagellar hook-length control protein FliK [Variovorax sp. VaC1]|uniref:flagellar hook-length control protein FliK n=1 Tax=Variovorax sp. VaC1 TaxID=3373132 RepID=UPI0037489400